MLLFLSLEVLRVRTPRRRKRCSERTNGTHRRRKFGAGGPDARLAGSANSPVGHARSRLSPLPQALQPLLVRFYRAHNSRNRGAEAVCWVAVAGRHPGGSMPDARRPRAFPDRAAGNPAGTQSRNRCTTGARGTGRQRGAGLAVLQARTVAFYTRLGFGVADQLPDTLAERLARYRRTKTLIALLNDRRIEPMPVATLTIAIACLFDEQGRVLVVRKRGTRFSCCPVARRKEASVRWTR